MTPEIEQRINAALDRLEDIEHRVGAVIEGGRMQLSHMVQDLKLRELQHELRQIRLAISKESPP